MTWFYYTLLAVFSYSLYYLFSRVFLKAKDSNAVTYAILFNFVCAAIVTVVAVINGFVLLDIKKYALNLILMAILYAAAQILIFKASKLIEASEVIILSATRVLWTIAGAILLLGESLNLQKAVGIFIIIFSVIFVSYKKKHLKISRGHWYAILAGFCLGIGFVNDAYILQHSDAMSYGAIVFILPLILTLLVYSSSLPKLKKEITLRLLFKNLLLGVVYSIGLIASFLAYQHGGNASQIVPMGQSVVVITVILAAIFLGERDSLLKKFVAAGLVTIGVLLIK